MGWTKYKLRDNKGVMISVRSASRWNDGYFTRRCEDQNRKEILRIIEDVKTRNPKDYDYHWIGDTITMYDNANRYDEYHAPKTRIVNEMVFERLRNGKPAPPEPTEWNSGKPQAELWST